MKSLAFCGIWAFVVSLCLYWGYGLERNGSVFGRGLLGILSFVLIFALLTVLSFVISSVLTVFDISEESETKSPARAAIKIIIFAGLILILWAPSFLAVYPGWFNYDAPWQIFMYRGNNISSHQPVLHTLLLGWIVEKNHVWRVSRGDYSYNYNASVALYTCFQMLVCSLGFGYEMNFVLDRVLKKAKKGTRLIFVLLCICFFGLYPPIVLLSMSPTKDVLFGIFLLVFLTKTMVIFWDKKAPDFIWSIMLVLCIIYRQNSLYVFILLAIPFVWSVGKMIGKLALAKTALLTAAAVCLLVLYYGPVYKMLDVTQGSTAEFLSVPSQQLVSVYLNHKNELTTDEIEAIEKLFDKKAFEKYRPKLADGTKGNMDMNLFANKKGEYAKLYFSLLTKYPKDYFNSFLILNYGLWYPDATMDMYVDGENWFFSTDYELAVPSSKIPQIYQCYLEYKNGGVVNNLVSRFFLMPAVFVYLALGALLLAIKKGDAGVIFADSILVLIFLTFILGPCASIRYMYYLYILLPVLALQFFTVGSK